MTERTIITGIALALSSISLILQSVWAVIFVSKWIAKDSNILIRNPIITLFFNLAMLVDVWIICALVSQFQPIRYGLRLVQNAFILAFIFGPYVIKTFELFYRFYLAEEIFALKSKAGPFSPKPLTSSSANAPVGWFLRNRYLITLKWQILLWIPWIIISFALCAFGPASAARGYSDAFLFLTGLSVVAVLFWKMRGKVDVWGIKRELKNVIITSAVGVGCFLVILGIKTKYTIVIAYIMYIICFQFVSFYSVGFPSLISRLKNDNDGSSVVSKSSHAVEYNLSSLLHNKVFLQGFEVWLIKAFSAENLSFITDVDRFLESVKDNFEDPLTETTAFTFLSHAAGIIETYIRNEGVIPVNISSEVRSSTISAFESIRNQISVEKNFSSVGQSMSILFFEARNEIFNLLETDSLPRYMETPEFKKFKEVSVKVDAMLNSASGDVDIAISPLSSPMKALLRKTSGTASKSE